MSVAVFLHLLADVVWIGGMFFAYLALRPAAARLELPEHVRLWRDALGRFFGWVWAALALVLGSGFYMLTVLAQAGRVALYVYLMLYIGIAMAVIFCYVFLSPYGALRRAAAVEDWNAGAAALAQIRRAVAVNLALGLVNVAVATLGRP